MLNTPVMYNGVLDLGSGRQSGREVMRLAIQCASGWCFPKHLFRSTVSNHCNSKWDEVPRGLLSVQPLERWITALGDKFSLLKICPPDQRDQNNQLAAMVGSNTYPTALWGCQPPAVIACTDPQRTVQLHLLQLWDRVQRQGRKASAKFILTTACSYDP